MSRDTLATKNPLMAFNGASGSVARLLRPSLPEAIWMSRPADWSAATAAPCWVCLGGRTSGSEEALKSNTDAAIDALNAGADAGADRVFLLSSAAIYGRNDAPLTEATAPTPASPYGAAKARMEDAVTDWAARNPSGPKAIILRLGNVAGADALLGGLRPDKTPTLHIFADGHGPRRSYVGPVTLARLLVELAAAPDLPPILNLTAPGTVGMDDLLRAAGRSWSEVPAPDSAIRSVELDTTLLSRHVTFSAQDSDASHMVSEWKSVT